eukprot:4547733-Lingulodinium_polyedra.AAC.1
MAGALPMGGAETPVSAAPLEPWQSAMGQMAQAVTQLATALHEQREASVLKWERKQPTIRMESAESYMHELVNLEN